MPNNNFAKEMDDILLKFAKNLEVDKAKGLQLAAKNLKAALIAATPRDTGNMQACWVVKKQKNSYYVGNTATTPWKKRGKNIPMSNLLEYATTLGNGKKRQNVHAGFIRKTFDAQKEQLLATIMQAIR